VTKPSSAEWAFPVVVVRKPDGTMRFCVDYRQFNEVAVREVYPLPRMDDCFDFLGAAKVFSTLDCNSGYWQIPVARRGSRQDDLRLSRGGISLHPPPLWSVERPSDVPTGHRHDPRGAQVK